MIIYANNAMTNCDSCLAYILNYLIGFFGVVFKAVVSNNVGIGNRHGLVFLV